MKRFIIKTSIFAFLIVQFFLWLCTRVDGSVDNYYLNFISPKQSCLILGTSKASQALKPQVFDSILHKEFNNFSFSMLGSPYGPTYLKSIKRKLKDNTQKGIFVLTVDPWSISTFSKNDDPSLFREQDLMLGTTPMVSINPNPFYILNNYYKKYYHILTDRDPNVFLHDDGWLEVSITMDSTIQRKRLKKKVQFYRHHVLNKSFYSLVRLEYLKETITYLSSYGKVYLVRLPVHKEIMTIENEFMPDFNNSINEAIELSSGYLDLTNLNDSFVYTDGNHLYKTSGEKVSRIIARWINEN